MFAQIIVDINHSEVDKIFTYLVPPRLEDVICIGMRVKIPFNNRKAIIGYILGFTDSIDFPIENIKEIISLCEKYPIINSDQMQLLNFMQSEYHAKAVDVIRLLVPAQIRNGKVKEKFTTKISLNAPINIAEQALEKMKIGTKSHLVLSHLIDEPSVDKALLSEYYGDINSALQTLLKKQLIITTQIETHRKPYSKITDDFVEWHQLNDMQQTVYDTITSNAGAYLLHGVTGSGKTEIYMRLIKDCIAANKSAIMLVPEISLTPQMVSNFRSRFGANIAVLHSGLSEGERYDEWHRIISGKASIVIGARSAIFAPCKNLGLIIIDEEHESSYLSDRHPRYDSIKVAEFRAKSVGGSLVLGSATPSIERYFLATRGRYKLLELPYRANGKPLPPCTVVDMSKEFLNGNKSVFSDALYKELQATLTENKQVILFLNRRGHSTFVMCRSCGEVIKCPNCDISMTYHNGSDKLKCHYCNYTTKVPTECPTCDSKYIRYFGAGTQKVEEDLKMLFPEVKAIRMDNDTTREKDSHYKLLQSFKERQADVLIGTQMIAKGLDFPDCTLVGVVSADTMLFIPDYKSNERAFSLITQVAGRAGRADADGTVVVQTYTPDHFTIKCAKNHNYIEFYKQEIQERQAMWYPPFAMFIRILFSAKDIEYTINECQIVFESIKNAMQGNEYWQKALLYFDISPAPISRIKGLYRYQILIKLKQTKHTKELADIIYTIADNIKKKNLYVNIEINPLNLF